MYCVSVSTGSDAGQRVTLKDPQTLLVGRGEDCGLRLSDPSASRVHCRFLSAGGKVFLEDASSRWGTLVNGVSVESQELQPGDQIVVGDTTLVLESDDPQTATAVPLRKRRSAEPSVLETDDRPSAEIARQARGAAAEPTPVLRRTVNFQKLVGERFLRFRVGSMIARTRSGALFRAFDPGKRTDSTDAATNDERVIALKVFSPEMFGDERATRRFVRGIRAMMPLHHEHLVRLHTAGRWQGLCFAASEFVAGESLTHVIQRVGVAGMLDWSRVWRIAVALARALEYSHERGVMHRNITPGHILVSGDLSVIKLGDLTLSKALDDCGEQITRPGELVGTLDYLAPEQVAADGWCDARTDIYSLGATLYAVLTGRPPFAGATTTEMIHAILAGDPVPPSRHHMGIPSHFEGVLLRMLARNADDRYASCSELLGDLERARKYSAGALQDGLS